MTKVKRSLLHSLLNTGTIGTPVWSIIGYTPSGDIDLKPKVESVIYITDNNATVTVEGYAPVISIEADAFKGDAIFEWIDSQRIGRDTLDDAESELINVYLYKSKVLTLYTAEKVACAVSCEKAGGKGGESDKISYTINMTGDPVPGWFSPLFSGWYHPVPGAVFLPSPVLAGLSSLTIGANALIPTFDTNVFYYDSGTLDLTDVLTVVPVTAGATIAIDVEGVPHNSGDTLTWDFGSYHITVTVTVGTEVVHYWVMFTHYVEVTDIALDGYFSLVPTYTPGTHAYTAETTDATNDIDVTVSDPSAIIEIDVDGVSVDNGDPITWAAGVNHVTVTVTAGEQVEVYTIAVTMLMVVSDIVLDGLTLNTPFFAGLFSYSTTTTDASNTVTVTSNDPGTTGVTIAVNGEAIDNGDPGVWEEGGNVVVVTAHTTPPVYYAITVTATLGA